MRSRALNFFSFIAFGLSLLLANRAQAQDEPANIKVHATVEKLPNGRFCFHLRWECTRDDVASFEVEEKCVDGRGTNYHFVYLAPGGRRGEFIETQVEPETDYLFRIRADYDNGTVSDYR